MAEKNIKNVKKQRLEKAKEALAKINVKENEQLKEKSQNMKKLINFMYTDIDSLLTLSMADADSNDLAIRLLKATADQLLIKKHKEANSLDDDGYVDVEEPFCAIY